MTLQEKIKKYGLTSKDWYQHKHYTIVTRMGIDKIQAIEKISIKFEAVKVDPEFCVVKAIGVKSTLIVETFGSAKYGAKEWNQTKKNGQGGWDEFGNTTTWYVMEMAEKRAMSRVVLKITGFYELGVFGEDESEDFKKEKQADPVPPTTKGKEEPTKPKLDAKGLAFLVERGTIENIEQSFKFRNITDAQKVLLDKKLSELKK